MKPCTNQDFRPSPVGGASLPSEIPPEARHDERWLEPHYLQKVKIKGRFAGLFVKFWVSAVRTRKIGWHHNEAALSTGKPLLYVCWHGSQVVPLGFFRDKGILILTSLSRDGDIQDVCMKTLGFRTIRGSSSRGGAKALLGMIKELKQHGAAAITVDGPRGPFHEAKPGAVLLAQKTDAVVIPVGVAHTRCRQLKSWDRFEIPLPFSQSVLVVGEPFQVPSHFSLDQGARLIEEKIAACDRRAKQEIE